VDPAPSAQGSKGEVSFPDGKLSVQAGHLKHHDPEQVGPGDRFEAARKSPCYCGPAPKTMRSSIKTRYTFRVDGAILMRHWLNLLIGVYFSFAGRGAT
jgi:hypothetical protein